MAKSNSARLAILTYHSLDNSGSVLSVTPRAFAQQMATLAELGYRGIALREAVTCRASTGGWPDRSVVVTFDDGYANVYEQALPVLARYGFAGTVFLVTGHVGKQNDWSAPPAGLGRRAMLSWRQAVELAAAGIEIGAHTCTHADLSKIAAGEIKREITACRAEIEERLQEPVDTFAYPFGRVCSSASAIVSSAFRASCATTLARAGDGPLHALPRVDMYYIQTRRALQRCVEGRLDMYLAWRRWGRSVRRLSATR